jgi:hypothetical protein
MVDPGFITCDDPLQKVVTFFVILSELVGTHNLSADTCVHLSVP